MADFPITLPDPLIDGYSGSQDQAFIRTEMEGGSVRQRQRFSAANTQLNVSWIFDSLEMSAFKTFFDSTINRGSDWFSMDLNVGGGSLTYDVRFTKPYQFTFVDGGYWRVNGELEVRNA